MLRITHNKGFQMTFANGYTISVQFGNGNYCDNRHYGSMVTFDEPVPPSRNAEVAAWDKDGNWVQLSEHDDVIGWQTPDDIAALIASISSR
jgi:hypothetical protein